MQRLPEVGLKDNLAKSRKTYHRLVQPTSEFALKKQNCQKRCSLTSSDFAGVARMEEDVPAGWSFDAEFARSRLKGWMTVPNI